MAGYSPSERAALDAERLIARAGRGKSSSKGPRANPAPAVEIDANNLASDLEHDFLLIEPDASRPTTRRR